MLTSIRVTPEGRRNARAAALGSVLFFVGLASLFFVGVGQLDRALSIHQPVIGMTGEELLASGRVPADGSLVRLRDVSVALPVDPTDPRNATQRSTDSLGKVQAFLSHQNFKPLWDRWVQGSVVPRQTPDSVPRLRLGRGRSVAELAQREVSETGSLVVHVIGDGQHATLLEIAEKLSIPLPESATESLRATTLTLTPVATVGTVRNAMLWLLGSIVVTAIGVLLCGSAKLGRWVLLCPTGALIGLPGLPLRCDGSRRLVRRVYVIVGVLLLVVGDHLLVTVGGLGTPMANGLIQGIGGLSLSLGLAAILGAVVGTRQAVVSLDALGRTRDSRDEPASTPTRKPLFGKRKSTPVAVELPLGLQVATGAPGLVTRRFLDPKLRVSAEVEPIEAIAEQTQSLEKKDFDSPLLVEITRTSGTANATVQLGCNSMVMAMTEFQDEELRFRLISCLSDGHFLITLSEGFDRLTKSCEEFVATATVNATDSLIGLLATHLDRASKVAAKHRCRLTRMDALEWRDVLHCVERCEAELASHLGTEKWDIGDASYGRFHFPPQPIAQPVESLV